MITIEEAKAFITEADKCRKDAFLPMAEKSWNEIKKRNDQGRLYSSGRTRRGGKYPAWYSIFKIRQPLVLSRIGIPIGKDTTQDGNDGIGATAAILIERLAINLARGFNFFDVMAAARDDFLATNFGQVRAYYERDEIKERVKEYIQPQQNPETGEAFFVDSQGNQIQEQEIMEDDSGFFIEHDQVVDVENEKICLRHVLYSRKYIDPGITTWAECERVAFECYYSEPQFIEIFGKKAFMDIPKPTEDSAGDGESNAKRQVIKVFEYWDKYEKDCYWWADNGPDFIKPKNYLIPEGDEYSLDEPLNGLYNLENLFPCPEPLRSNTATDEFWPIPEYYQLIEVFEDIHTIFARMMSLTRAIRARLLYDDSIDGLEEALSEATEGDAFGVTNLVQALTAANGSLENVVQYIPVEKLINGLNQLYIALEQRLNTIYKLTGTSDLLQGLITDTTDRTLGERQMLEKYSLNQIAEPQRKMQEFVRASYQLMCEMALKNFKEASLDRYMMPETLQPEHQQRYRAAQGLLKSNTKRFRIELETDSTIALNEQYDKQMRVELVNALTSALEKTANIAATQPALVVPELHALKFLVQGFRQAKLFQSEISTAIDNVIKQAESAPPSFNGEQVMAELKAKELDATNKLKEYEIMSKERIDIAKIQQDERLAGLEAQLEQFKLQAANAQGMAELQLQYQELGAEIQKAQQEMALKRDELMVELQKIADIKQREEYQQAFEQAAAKWEIQFRQQEQALEEQKVMLDEKEKYMTEARLQAEHQLEMMSTKMDMLTKMVEVQKPSEMAPNITVHVPPPPKRRRKTKIQRDELGNIANLESEDIEE